MKPMNRQTTSQTVGPFFKIGMTYGELNKMASDETQGEQIYIHGRVFDGNGKPVDDAIVELWQADASGIYSHIDGKPVAGADPNFMGFGRSSTTDDGEYWFRTIKPGAVEGQAPHILVRIFMRGLLLHVVTRLYFSDEDNSGDEILNGVPAERRHTMTAQRGEFQGSASYFLDFNMQGENETVFFEP